MTKNQILKLIEERTSQAYSHYQELTKLFDATNGLVISAYAEWRSLFELIVLIKSNDLKD